MCHDFFTLNMNQVFNESGGNDLQLEGIFHNN